MVLCSPNEHIAKVQSQLE